MTNYWRFFLIIDIWEWGFPKTHHTHNFEADFDVFFSVSTRAREASWMLVRPLSLLMVKRAKASKSTSTSRKSSSSFWSAIGTSSLTRNQSSAFQVYLLFLRKLTDEKNRAQNCLLSTKNRRKDFFRFLRIIVNTAKKPLYIRFHFVVRLLHSLSPHNVL